MLINVRLEKRSGYVSLFEELNALKTRNINLRNQKSLKKWKKVLLKIGSHQFSFTPITEFGSDPIRDNIKYVHVLIS